MLPHFVDFINPVTDERFIVAFRQLDGEKLIQKYYPQLHFVLFSIPNDNFTKVADFIIKKIGVKALKVRLRTNMFMSIRMNIKTNIFAIRELSNYM